jgi:hypothetical protein
LQVTNERKSAQSWHDELKRYKEDFSKFTGKGEKIIQRFRDERKDSLDEDSKFNILWSNVRTLKPAIYSRPPKPEVSRRFKDDNQIARVASIILERAIDYELKQFSDYHSALSNAVEDRLLPGRGVAWIRYEPKTETIEEPQISEDVEAGDEDEYSEAAQSSDENSLAGETPEPMERITSETTPIDYVYWKDFAHLPARTWEEVTWVARRVYLSKDEGVERFGDDFKLVPLTHSPDAQDKEKDSTAALKKAEVWEIWCKPTAKVHWVAANYEYILDEKDDPLQLSDFFPCPKPIYATVTTGSLCPVADYILYQDQAQEIDEITARIKHLTSCMKVMGIYAADEAALGRLLKEGKDGILIPVKNWPLFMEKGGLRGAVEFMPLGDIISALAELYKNREACKQIIYEVTGISDIIRGASAAQETATAQQIKSQFASLRLNDMKDDVARFARDLLRMKSEIMCSRYQPQTLLDASGIMYTPDAEFAEQAIQLLQNETARNFSIDIENDTLVQIDEDQDKKDRIEFLGAASQFLEKAVTAGQQSPELVPLLGDLLMFGIRGFKVGRSLEATFESTLEKMKQAQQQKAQQPPKPDPEQLKAQAEQQQEQAQMEQEAQLEQMRLSHELQLEQMRMENDNKRYIAGLQAAEVEKAKDQEFEMFKLQKQMEFEQWKIERQSANDLIVSATENMHDAHMMCMDNELNNNGEED